MVGLAMAQAVQDLMYFPYIPSKIRPIEILLQYCHCFLDPEMPSNIDCSVLPKSSWHARLKEHKGDRGGIIGHPGGENLEPA